MQRWEYTLLKSKPVQHCRNWLKAKHYKALEGSSLYEILNFFRKEIFSIRFNDRASAVSFKFLMAIPPTLLLLFTLIPYWPIGNLDHSISEAIKFLVPNASTQKTINKIVTDFYAHKKNTLLSFSLILTLYYSSNGMLGLMRQFNKALPGFKKRNLVTRRGMAVGLTFLLILSVILTTSIFILQQKVIRSLQVKWMQKSTVTQLISYAIIIGMIFLTVSAIYKYGPSLKKRWKWVTPGSIVATVLIVSTTFLLNWAVNNLINYNRIYGSISTLIVFILWVFYNAQILLIGFELNVSIMVNKYLKEGKDLEASFE